MGDNRVNSRSCEDFTQPTEVVFQVAQGQDALTAEYSTYLQTQGCAAKFNASESTEAGYCAVLQTEKVYDAQTKKTNEISSFKLVNCTQTPEGNWNDYTQRMVNTYWAKQASAKAREEAEKKFNNPPSNARRVE